MDNHITAERIADILLSKNIEFNQKHMFGGECFMVDEKMLMGTYKGGVMARVGPDEAAAILVQRSDVSQMMNGGRIMAGYLFVEPDGFDSDTELVYWVEKCLAFNPKAKSSVKKK